MLLSNTIYDILYALFYLILCAAIFSGLLLIYLAHLGKKLDNHPVCKYCKYDLYGSPRPFLECPDCGRPIHDIRYITHGNRRKRPQLQILGLILILPAFTYLAIDFYADATGQPLAAFTPSNILHYQLEYTQTDSPSHLEAMDQLIKRAAYSDLKPQTVSELLTELLTFPRTELITYEPTFSQLLLAAYQQNRLSRNHLTLLQDRILPHFEFEIKPEIFEGNNLPITFTASGPLLGIDRPVSPLTLRYTLTYAFNQNQSFARYRKQHTAHQTLSIDQQLDISMRHIERDNLKPNQEHTLSVIFSAELFDRNKSVVVHRWTKTLEKPFKIRSRRVAHDYDSNQFITLRRAIAAPLRKKNTPLSLKIQDDMIYTYFNCPRLPIDMLHQFNVQIDNQPAKTVATVQGRGPWEMTIGIARTSPTPPQTITFRLIPMLDEAEQDFGLHRLFNANIEVTANLKDLK
ncbi:hypothetical protein KS4_32330 [Poriferisphaera corsica]|uniref:Uncharacterized protein n=1 Tax=Poriferisphaera corsica TaxID=2528020 RepID=A0A517YY41_9BACT|nr:hypothetical protein [Poriferisphaera corsica]QDU35153.1 hypothetical protein KS4_32330 [Poriferisphaera corsica]